eukprot:GEMP01084428.1.p1 GENE.GEMP01084428.1~~GEMP01084428.1.p1  ORF type:complete len:217 (+),score=42.22 GEMP01084428.1:72-722(+)
MAECVQTPPEIILFGDSITQQSFSIDNGGWGARLSDHFSRRADVLNRGFSGYTTRWALNGSGPDTRIILLTPPPVCHRQRLEFQRVRFPDSPSGQLERTNDNAEKYAKACVDVARESNVSVVNLWELMMEAAKASDVGQEESMQQDAEPWGRYLSDGLHLSHAGNTFVFSKLLETVERDWPELRITPCKSTGSTANSGSSCPALLPHLLWHDAIPN